MQFRNCLGDKRMNLVSKNLPGFVLAGLATVAAAVRTDPTVVKFDDVGLAKSTRRPLPIATLAGAPEPEPCQLTSLRTATDPAIGGVVVFGRGEARAWQRDVLLQRPCPVLTFMHWTCGDCSVISEQCYQ
jgi:hypothetical protein